MATGTVRLDRPTARHFADRSPDELPDYEVDIMAGLLAQFDLTLERGQRPLGGGNAFAQMGAELLETLERPLPAPDVLVLAYRLPELNVADVAACDLAERFGGAGASFSVSEQGVGAGFTALRILRGMRSVGTIADGAVLVLDQSTSFFHDPDTHDLPITDTAVLLRADPRPGTGAVLEFLEETEVGDDPEDGFRDLLSRNPDADLITGRGLASRLGADASQGRQVLSATAEDPRRLCTDVWALLAESWPLHRLTVVADYDPHAGRLFAAGLRPEAAA